MSCIIIALINVLYLHGLKGFADVGWAAKRGGLVFWSTGGHHVGIHWWIKSEARPTTFDCPAHICKIPAPICIAFGIRQQCFLRPQEGCKILWWVRMYVCLSVRLITRKPYGGLHQFCASCLYRRGSIFLWLGAIAYVMYFRFCGWSHVFTQWQWRVVYF